MPSVLSKTNRNNLEIVALGRLVPSLRDLLSMLITFALTVFAWIFFRAANFTSAIGYINEIFSISLFSTPELSGKTFTLIFILLLFILIEWNGREEEYAIASLGLKWPQLIKWPAYYTVIISIIYFSGAEQQFIYFQF